MISVHGEVGRDQGVDQNRQIHNRIDIKIIDNLQNEIKYKKKRTGIGNWWGNSVREGGTYDR